MGRSMLEYTIILIENWIRFWPAFVGSPFARLSFQFQFVPKIRYLRKRSENFAIENHFANNDDSIGRIIAGFFRNCRFENGEITIP